jgi:two-component system, sensor histidine kinase and response regulator
MSSVNDARRSVSVGVFDYPGAMVRLGDDAELFDNMARMFLADSASLMVRILESSLRGDQAELALAAHTLLGLASNFGASRVTTAAAEVESAARNSESNRGTDLHELESAVDELTAALRRHLEPRDSVRSSS